MGVKILFIHALTSIHPGTGQGVGTIDLPVARERATNLPVIPGSTLKGCIKAAAKELTDANREKAFGKEDAQGEVRFGDGRLLLLPVRSLGSTFVWATCPYVLRRFQRDCNLLKAGATPPESIPEPGDEAADVADLSAAIQISGKARLVLEDLDFKPVPGGARQWADWIAALLFPGDQSWTREFVKRFVVLNDASFDYLCEFATEVNAHVRIGENGTVESGALWYEETLPAETVFVSVIQYERELPQDLIPTTIQLGGNETTGQGLTRLVVPGGKA